MQQTRLHRLLTRASAITTAAVVVFSLAACSNSSSNAENSNSNLPTMTGITAEGKEGQKPKITFKTPFTVKNNSYQLLQEGTGKTVTEGATLCANHITFDAKTGSALESTWESKPECSIIVSSKSLNPDYYKLFKSMKIGTTFAIGINTAEQAQSQTTTSSDSYIQVLTLMSMKKTLTRAKGTAVKNIPEDLPKVTLDKDGKPSIDLNGFKPGSDLRVQPLIEGTGDTVSETDTISVNYTGWLASDGKQFDSSWDRGTPASFAMNQVIKGWTQGLAGQKVGSQVLLIVPPDYGYGSNAQGSIPANSTLIFVVDILAKS